MGGFLFLSMDVSDDRRSHLVNTGANHEIFQILQGLPRDADSSVHSSAEASCRACSRARKHLFLAPTWILLKSILLDLGAL
jgi:hypothetical protein